mgnify:CR=1 FL=1
MFGICLIASYLRHDLGYKDILGVFSTEELQICRVVKWHMLSNGFSKSIES